MRDKQCETCECVDVIDVMYSPERAKVMKEQRKNKSPFSGTFAFLHSTIPNYGQQGVTVSHISDYSPEKQAEWAAIKPYDKNAYKGMDTLAPQRKMSPFKDMHTAGGSGGGW